MQREATSYAAEMMELFKGLARFRGILMPPTRYETVPDDPNTVEHWTNHLAGKVGLGINPLMADGADDGKVWWGSLDIDRHKTGDQPLDVPEMAMKVQQLGLPLLCFSSKSKGSMHMHLFLAQPTPATLVVRLLKHWAVLLGEAGCEVFPKQTKLAKGAAGNWINMPYFDGDNTVRFCYHSNKKLTLAEFVETAKTKRQTLDDLKALLKAGDTGELADAPPCVEYFLTKGLPVGARNEGLFTVATYLRRKDEDNWKDRVAEINQDKTIMEKALPTQQLNTLVRSVDKGGYTKYRCNQPPMCDHCDKDMCMTRKFGIGPDGPQKAYDQPNWGSLTKIMTDPPRYELGINGKLIMFDSTQEIMSARTVREKIMAYCNILIPPMKDQDWQPILAEKLESMQEESAPEDAGPASIIGGMLDRFLQQAERYDEEGKPVTGDRKNVMRGKPVLTVENDKGGNQRYIVMFRSEDFIIYLKKNKAEEVKGGGLWSLMRTRFNCEHKKFRGILPSGNPKEVWYRPFDPDPISFDSPTIEEKF